jgi:hypothetical protein
MNLSEESTQSKGTLGTRAYTSVSNEPLILVELPSAAIAFALLTITAPR